MGGRKRDKETQRGKVEKTKREKGTEKVKDAENERE